MHSPSRLLLPPDLVVDACALRRGELVAIVATVRRLAKLTRTEEVVVVSYLLGEQPGQLHDGRWIEMSTLRTHERHIREKTGHPSMGALRTAILRRYFLGDAEQLLPDVCPESP